MNKINYIILILIVVIFLGYMYEFFPLNETWGFPYSPILSDGSEIEISRQWYISLLADKLRYVILAWALWVYAIPVNQTSMKLGAAVFCVKLTFVPINWVLFYMTPFKEGRFLVMIILSITVGFFITYLNGVYMRRKDNSSSNYR